MAHGVGGVAHRECALQRPTYPHRSFLERRRVGCRARLLGWLDWSGCCGPLALSRWVRTLSAGAGINFNDGMGGGDLIRGNLIANCVRESGDHGPFNSWDRVPYITTLRNGTASIIPQWREITKNLIYAVYASQVMHVRAWTCT